MKKSRQLISGALAGICMMILVLDSKTAVSGAEEGVALCIQTVIPSLFPFIVISIIASSYLSSVSARTLGIIGRLCSIPNGSESLFLLGLLGGYPVGAQNVALAFQSNRLSKEEAERLLGFCNNVGPAFIFGMVSNLFSSPLIAWVLWIIQIIGAVTVGMLIPAAKTSSSYTQPNVFIRPTIALERGVRATAMICGWVILFRVILAFGDRWFFWMLPQRLRIILIGLLELVNGCSALKETAADAERFILCSLSLAFGGACVAMQTVSVTGGLPTGGYFRGKLMQSVICTILSYFTQYLLFPKEQWVNIPIAVVLSGIIFVYLLSGRRSIKKRIAFRKRLMYNS